MQEAWVPLLLTLKVAGWATALNLLLGVGVGFALARLRFPGRELLDALLTLPMVMPPTVLGYYLLVLIGRKGPLGAWLQAEFGINLIFTWQGAVIAATIVAFPLVFKSARAAFENVDSQLENAARVLGVGEAYSGGEDEAAFVVVLDAGGRNVGLVVDNVLDTEEIVVKPSSTMLRDITMFSGNAILGDGSVIMILDPNGLAATMSQNAVETADNTMEENDAKPGSRKTPLLAGDTVLLCSDGVWGPLGNEALLKAFDNPDVMTAVPRLMDLAEAAGGETADNLTTVALNWHDSYADADEPRGAVTTKTLPLDRHTTVIESFGDRASMREEWDESAIESAIAEINSAINKYSKGQ